VRFFPLLLLPVLALAHDPIERLQTSHLEAVHAQRIEWMKKRAPTTPPAGIYQDYRAILRIPAGPTEAAEILSAAKADGVKVVSLADRQGPKTDPPPSLRDGVLFISDDAASADSHGIAIYSAQADASIHQAFYDYIRKAMKQPLERRRLVADFKAYPDEFYAAGTGVLPQLLSRWDEEIFPRRLTGIAANDADPDHTFNGFDPYAVAFRFVSTHILARDLTGPDIRASLDAGHVYVAHDWLCDPTGFSFTAQNNLGVFDVGDSAEMTRNTRLMARLPIKAKIKLIHANAIIAESSDSKFSFAVKETGAYRLEAWLTIDGEDRPWIFSNPIYIADQFAVDPPPPTPRPPAIDITRNISYADGDPADADKHKLDLYLPRGKTNFPVMVFFHGGSWNSGDRSGPVYGALGSRFARAGIGVAIPSYRLMPNAPHPAQIEDAAAAFAWVYKHIDSYGGDPSRIYLVGHSAGGHLVALLALDSQYMKKLEIPGSAIHGVAALSGIYDVSRTGLFGDHGLDASPIQHLHSGAPPFLITYCQWDYEGLPRQARDFAAGLKSKFVPARLVYIPGKNHISEIVGLINAGDPTAAALLDFIK
jgi:acetyl esterase/lipase